MRFSISLRSRWISELPVPLNSSKMTFIHARAGVDERSGDDGQRSALFDVAGRAKEALRFVERVESTPPERILPDGGTTVL